MLFDRPPLPDYVEPPLPADLPAGEAKRTMEATMWGAASPHPPQTAPGFTRALELGLLPPAPPLTPPAPLPGMSSQQQVWTAIGLAFGSFLAPAGPLPTFLAVTVVTVCWAAAFWLLASPSASGREQAECDAGYTSRDAFSGLWRLAKDGRVLRAPDRSVPPPGWYPSPYWPGLLQRWDGPGWKPLPQKWRRHPHRYVRRPDTPFL